MVRTQLNPASDAGGVNALEAVIGGLWAKSADPGALRKFTGRLDVAGNPVWTEGRILAVTLYRLKRHAEPYVIHCQVDFAVLDEKQHRKLIVGMTRAQMHLKLVIFRTA